MTERKRWYGSVPSIDDFGNTITNEFIDGRTCLGPWAMMAPKSFKKYGVGRFGTGSGQRYVKENDGVWYKAEG